MSVGGAWRRDKVQCPHCEKLAEDYVRDYSDWLYNNNLYGGDGNVRNVSCPYCSKKFFVSISMVPEWHSVASEDEL